MQTPPQKAVCSDEDSLQDDTSTSDVVLEMLAAAALPELLIPIVHVPGKSIIPLHSEAELAVACSGMQYLSQVQEAE